MQESFRIFFLQCEKGIFIKLLVSKKKNELGGIKNTNMSFKKYTINIVNFFCYFCCIKCLYILVEVLLHFSRNFSRPENKIGMIFTLNRVCFGK